ncbi:hypothetical protein DMB37_37970 [Nocardia sp. CS682]|nr:hypothetical protein DMB37_37970 [Nocardia sp. CS682]
MPTAVHLIDFPSAGGLPVHLTPVDHTAPHAISIGHHYAPNIDHDNKIYYEAVDRVQPLDDTDN